MFLFFLPSREGSVWCLSRILWLRCRMCLLPGGVQHKMYPTLSCWEVERKSAIYSVLYISCKCVGNACLKFWSKLPWCSHRWDKLFDERNHIRERILWEEGRLYLHEDQRSFTWIETTYFFSPGWCGKSNLHGWKRKVLSL